MARFDSWESYFYPETVDPATGHGTLRNRYGERHPGVLQILEYTATANRRQQIDLGLVDIARTYDADQLKAIHQHLFQDVYEWAGDFRTITLTKPGAHRHFGHPDLEVDRLLQDAHDVIVDTDWGRLSRERFIAHTATVMAYVNQAHPFREGNGRTLKAFLEEVAEQSQFTLEFDRVSPHEWNNASEDSRPWFGYEPRPQSLLAVFEKITQDRP